MNKQTKGSIFVFIICLQIVLLGSSTVNVRSFNKRNYLEPENIPSQIDNPSHYSPFYFPVNKSSPLILEEDLEDDLEASPKLSNSESNNYNVLTVNLDKYAVISGESITINLKLTSNLTDISGEMISVEIYQGYYRNYYSYYPNYYETTTPIYTRNVTTNSNGEAIVLFSSTSSEGIYTVYAYAQGCKSYKEFTVGEVGIFCKSPRYYKLNQKYTAAVHIVNLSDFSGIPYSDFNYSLSYYDYYVSDWYILTSDVGKTDDCGYMMFSLNIPIHTEVFHYLKLVITTPDEKAIYTTNLYESWDYYYYSLWGGEQETSQEQMQYVVTTDKTIYSPGETIHLRALVLEYSFMNESKQILRNSPISLTIYNPSEFAIFWTTVTTDKYGVVTFDLPLDSDCELGFYGFEFSQSNNEYKYNVKVDYYEKPAFRVEIDTNGQDFYPNNEKLFEGFVEVSYYFGQPVIGATVEFMIQNYMGEIKYSVEGVTNSEGRFYFSILLNSIEDIEYTFNAQAEVVDMYGRNARSEKAYTRIEEIYAYGYLSDWAPKPLDQLEYYFYVYQYVMSEDLYGYGYWNYNPLSNVSVNIDIYGIKDYPWYSLINTDEKLLASYSETTNIFGSGKLEFNLPLDKIKSYNFFEIRLTVDLEDDRSTTSSYYYRYKKYSLDIDISDPILDLGQVLEFNVTYKDILTNLSSTGEGKIYIYDSQRQLIGQYSGIFSGTKTLSLTISGAYPEGSYYIYSYVCSRSNLYYYGFNYHSAHESFLVGSYKVLTFNTNFNNTGNYYDQIKVQIGDTIEISGFSNVSSNVPHFLEIYKRGLLYSFPVIISGNNFYYNLSVIAEYAPEFTIIIYTISELGKLYESILSVSVDFSYNIELSTDKEIYEPGDELTLTITPSENFTSLIALSFIDSAVLDVEPEDDSELAYFKMNPYSTYIGSGSSWGSRFDASSYWWFGYGGRTGGLFYTDYYVPLANKDNYFFGVGTLDQEGRAPPSFDELLSTFDTEIRKNISESTNWMPEIIISDPTNFTFKLPDNIGEWTIRAVANSISEISSNLVLWGDVITKQIKTFLPFFIEFEIPQPIFQDDILSIKGYLYNYIGEDVHATVAINAPDLEVLNREVQEIFIPNNYVSEVEFSVYCTEAYNQNITLLATTEVSGAKYSDAKQLTTYIKPNGIEIINRTIGFLNTSNGELLLNYTVDPLAIYHKETLALYTDLMDISIDSWQSLVGYPYGCIEQTMSKTLPTALIFDYLRNTGQLSSNLEREMTSMILEGLSRIYNFQHSDGGWGWWQNDNTKIIMTAIVISALNQIEEVGFTINSQVLKKGIEYLILHQEASGAWDFQEYSSNTLEATAYIIKAIIKNKNKTSQM
ncbi:MAG: MG2 domain-containing protein, partial [Candidatus Hodarchaeales archaeon]